VSRCSHSDRSLLRGPRRVRGGTGRASLPWAHRRAGPQWARWYARGLPVWAPNRDPWAGDSGPLLLRRFEAEELHLDESGGVERELPRFERRGRAVASRRELDDDGFVALDQDVDEKLVGPGREVEMLEGI